MLLNILKSKIHRATITDSDLHYEESLSIDEDLMLSANILEHEAVHVWNINNGERLITYAIPAEPGSGKIQLNGSAARLGQEGDLIIIATFVQMTELEAKEFSPKVVLVDSYNKIK